MTIRLARSSSPNRGALLVATDEARDLAREVGRRFGRPERSGVVGGARHDEPVERQRIVEVLDGAQAVVDEHRVRRPASAKPAASALASAFDTTIWPPFAAAAMRAA